jgi:hypothetical protein
MAIATIVVILGNTNDATGQLSPVAVSRLDTALAYFRSLGGSDRDRTRFVTTGGFGAFNPSSVPHGELMNRYLVANGLPESMLLPFINSNGTIDDGLGVARLRDEMGLTDSSVVIITSAFHMPRASMIFSRAMPGAEVLTISDRDTGTPQQALHEQRAMRNLDRELPVPRDESHAVR